MFNGSVHERVGHRSPYLSFSAFIFPLTSFQDTEESSSSTPATQFIMLPLPAHSVVENPASIKLVRDSESCVVF